MKRNWLVAAAMILALLAGPAARAADDQATQSSNPAEYAALNAAANEKDITQRVKLLDDFVAKYPNSPLLPYSYQSYYLAYSELRNYIQVMAYCDKLLALGEKVDALQGLGMARLQALELRARVFFLALGQRQLTTNDQFTSARDSAVEGVKFIAERKKPEGITDEQFAQQNTSLKSLFHSVAGFASMQLKDFKAAADSFKGALAITPNEASLHYRLGLTYIQDYDFQRPRLQAAIDEARRKPNAEAEVAQLTTQMTTLTGEQMDGFWEIARAVSLKVQGEAQVRNYLKSQLNRYQQPTCDALLDAQLNELITLAGASAERPASYTITSRAQLDKTLQENGTVDAIINGLKAGGDTSKRTWLAACGAEFPELGGKVFEVAEADGAVVLKVFTASNEEAISVGTAPNLEVHVAGEPRAKRLKKDDLIAFSATLKSFTPEPFLLVVDKAKVREDTLPAEEKPPAKARAKKAPPKKAPTKRPPPKGAAL